MNLRNTPRNGADNVRRQTDVQHRESLVDYYLKHQKRNEKFEHGKDVIGVIPWENTVFGKYVNGGK